MDSSSKTSSRNAMTGRLADDSTHGDWQIHHISLDDLGKRVSFGAYDIHNSGILYSVVTIETCPKACPMPTSKKC